MKIHTLLLSLVTLSSVATSFAEMKEKSVTKKIELPKEIEIKIRPTESQLDLLKKWLKQNAQHKGMKRQKDVYVDNPEKSFTFNSHGFIDAYDKLRVRFEKNKESICYKYRHVDPKTNKTLSCDELEFPITDHRGIQRVFSVLGFDGIKLDESCDGEKILALLEKHGFTRQDIIEKDRDAYLYKEFEIVIDDVKDLGIFVEVELKNNESNVRKGIRDIYDLLKLIGFKKIVQFDRSYLHMLWNPTYDFSEEVDVSNVI